MDIVPETINRIRVTDNDLVLLHRVLQKVDQEKLSSGEKGFIKILLKRVEGRLELIKEGMNLV